MTTPTHSFYAADLGIVSAVKAAYYSTQIQGLNFRGKRALIIGRSFEKIPEDKRIILTDMSPEALALIALQATIIAHSTPLALETGSLARALENISEEDQAAAFSAFRIATPEQADRAMRDVGLKIVARNLAPA